MKAVTSSVVGVPPRNTEVECPLGLNEAADEAVGLCSSWGKINSWFGILVWSVYLVWTLFEK